MRRSRQGGFSLVELAVTVAVVAIIAAIAFPNFQDVLRSNRVASSSNELAAAISLARVEALRSPGGAGLCASADGSACGTDWNAGWMVWVDSNGNGQRDVGASPERVVKVARGGALTVTETGATGKLLFDRRGRVKAGTASTLTLAPSNGCPTGSPLVRELSVSAAGQVRVLKKACS